MEEGAVSHCSLVVTTIAPFLCDDEDGDDDTDITISLCSIQPYTHHLSTLFLISHSTP